MEALRDYCRLCMRKRDSRVDLFYAVKGGNSLINRIESIFSIQIDANDELPSFACIQCTQMLEETEAFSNIIRSTQREYQELLNAHQQINLMQGICPSVAEQCSQDDMVIEDQDLGGNESAEGEDGAAEIEQPADARKIKIKRPKRGSFPCEICGKVLSQNSVLQNHMKIHQEKREAIYICEICGKGFDIQSNLTAHTYTHRDQKTEECPHCGKHFLRLKRHIKANHLQGEHGTCTICNKSYKSIRGHNASFHKETDPDKFTCKVCGKVLAHRKSYQRHLVRHAGLRYNCLFCPHEATEKSNSRTHMRNKHPIEWAAHLKEKEKKLYQPRVKKGV